MNIGAVLLLLFCISTTRSFQSKGSLPLGIWNEIVINPGLNVFNFGISSDSSGFLSYSIHSPFTKIWASLVSGCPTYSSQYGYNLGLVDRQRIVNTTQELFVCSYHAHPIRAATRAFFYGSEFAIPGGCGKGSSDSFASSTISSHWEGDNIYPSSSDGVILNSSAHLNQWTSTIRFYSVSEFRSTVDKCNSELSTNSSFLDRIIYHIYQVPLVTSGGSSDSFVNPSTSEVLKILSHVSSPVDALFRGTLVTSVYARHLQLFEDNSHEIRFTRHLGTASVVNVIAEYKVMPVSSVASSTFVAYAPTVLYTCPPTDRTPSQDINFSSNQLGCELLPEFSLATRLCVGVILVAALFFTLSGSFCVWLRCSAALMMVFSLTCLVCFYRYAPLPTNIFYLTVAGILVPVALSILITFFVWILCTRHSNARSPIPVSLGVFYPVSETPSTYYYNYGAISGDDVTDPFYGRGSRGWKPRRHLRSSENLLSSPLLHPDPSDSTAPVSNVSANGNVAVNVSTGFGGCGRRPNQYKLRRLLRLVPAIPAVFLISCLIMGPLVSRFDTFRTPTAYLCFFSFIYGVAFALMFVFKNMAFGLSVAITGLYISLSCIAMLFYPNSLLPYVLLDQFLIFTWPNERLKANDISVYGINDSIFLAAWLCGSVIVGFITMCTLRLTDSWDHNASRGQNPVPPPTVPTSNISWLRRQRLRFAFYRNRGEPTSSVVTASSTEVPVFANSTFPTPMEEQQNFASTAWPPQPFTEQPLVSIAPGERRAFQDRQVPLYSAAPLVPLSRTQIAAAGSTNEFLSSLDTDGVASSERVQEH